VSTTFGESTSRKSLDFEYEGHQLWGCGPWRWYIGVGRIHMNMGRVGEERGGKEKDRCPLTGPHSKADNLCTNSMTTLQKSTPGCCRLPTSPPALTSTASDELEMHWDRST
jgi:hypothetical protein